jgi:hypothetical protein
MAEAPVIIAFYSPRLKLGVKFEERIIGFSR